MSSGLTIAVSPGLQEIRLNPGEVYKGSFNVLNPTSNQESVNYSISVVPLSFENETYELYFDYPLDYNQIKDWISIEETNGVLAGGEERRVDYEIAVPEDAPAGGQYAAFIVRINTQENEEKIGVSVVNNSQVAMLLYATVNGQTKEEGKILENRIKSFFLGQPIRTTVFLENTGNVHSKASFQLEIYPLFSDIEVYSNEDIPETSVIIPGTTHYSEHVWEETPKLGVYKVIQSVEFGGTTDTVQRTVLVCPIWFLFLSLAFITSCFLYLIEKISKRKQQKTAEKTIDFNKA